MFTRTYSIDGNKMHSSPSGIVTSNVSYPSRTIVHPKLEMTTPGDSDELEADAVANDVMSGRISRQISGGSGGGMPVSTEMESRLNSLQGGGQAMPEGLRNMMERGFNRDFSQVRLHTDSEAADMSGSISAKAFTHGNDIYFNRGQFSPNTTTGQRLVAHELAHVAQGGRTVARQEDDSPAERIRRSEVMGNIHYCELRIDGLIDAIRDQEERDHSFFGRWAGVFNRDGFDANELIMTLREAKPVLSALKQSKNTLDKIEEGTNRVLGVINEVAGILAAHRNGNIDHAGGWVKFLKATKTAAFTTAGILAAGIAAPVAAAAVGGVGLTGTAATVATGALSGAMVGGGTSLVSSTATEISKEVNSGDGSVVNVLKATVEGALWGGVTGGVIKGIGPKGPGVDMRTSVFMDPSKTSHLATQEIPYKLASNAAKYGFDEYILPEL